MRIGLIQMDSQFGRVKENIEQAEKLALSQPADLYVLPELFNTGYNILTKEEIAGMAEEVGGGLTYQRMVQLAQKQKCYLVYGYAEKENDHLYNSAALVGPQGLIGNYRKTHLFGRENLFFQPGNTGFSVYDTSVGRIGLMICFDWYFPESARTLALKGAQIIAHPSNLVLPNCPAGMITRSLENRVFSVTCDRVGRENRAGVQLSYIGTSQVISPQGETLLRLSGDQEEIGVVEIDPALADQKKLNEFNDLLADRREEYYCKF